MFVFGVEGLIQVIEVGQVEVVLGVFFQFLIGMYGGIQFFEDVVVIYQYVVVFGVVQMIYVCYGLDQVVVFQRFVDVEYGVVWFVEVGEQFVDYDQQVWCVVVVEVMQYLFFIVFGVEVQIDDVLFLLFLYFWYCVFIDFVVVFVCVWWGDYYCVGYQVGVVQGLFVVDCIVFVVGSDLVFQFQIQLFDVFVEVGGDVLGDQFDVVGCVVDGMFVGEFFFEV